MANTFGVTQTAFAYRFSGQTFSDWAPQISHWVEMAASELAVVLRQQGRESGDVPGASDLYALCARYIEHAVMVDIARAQTRQDPEIAAATLAALRDFQQRQRANHPECDDELLETIDDE
jgi:hypothetical protein